MKPKHQIPDGLKSPTYALSWLLRWPAVQSNPVHRGTPAVHHSGKSGMSMVAEQYNRLSKPREACFIFDPDAGPFTVRESGPMKLGGGGATG